MNIERFEFLKTFIDKLEIDIKAGIIKNRKMFLNKRGYYQFTKCKGRYKYYTFHLHEVIAVAGGLNILDMTVNHIDGNKANNSIDNLEVLTRGENMAHAKKIGLILKGEKSAVSKLKDKDILDIRAKYQKGLCTFQDLADEYGVSNSHISRIIHKQLWVHI